MSELAEIVFAAAVYKVQTLVDNGIRLTLDLPETAIPQMALLAECQREGLALMVTVKEAEQKGDEHGKSTKIHI